MGKALAAVVALVALAWFASWIVGTPYWALYQLKRAIVAHDQATFRRFTDTGAVVRNGVDTLMDDAAAMVWGAPGPDDIWRGIGRRLTDDSLDALRPQLHALAMTAVEDQLQRRWLALTDTGRNSPHVEVIKVDWRGGVATVVIRMAGSETPVGFTMAEATDGHWQVVALDKAFMKELIRQARSSALVP
jgi:hypothetical protein